LVGNSPEALPKVVSIAELNKLAGLDLFPAVSARVKERAMRLPLAAGRKLSSDFHEYRRKAERQSPGTDRSHLDCQHRFRPLRPGAANSTGLTCSPEKGQTKEAGRWEPGLPPLFYPGRKSILSFCGPFIFSVGKFDRTYRRCRVIRGRCRIYAS
jgi:hypothetical protein